MLTSQMGNREMHTILYTARQSSHRLATLDGSDRELVTHFDTDAVS